MKVYFTCSARGTKTYGDLYRKIFDAVEQLGHDHVDDYSEDSDPDKVYESDHEGQVTLYKEAIAHIKESDIVLLEVSVHSLTMGFLMQKALELGKPVIAMYLSQHAPVFANGIENDKLQLVEYSEATLQTILQEEFTFAAGQVDTRFNFFISPKIGMYLDSVSKKKRIPRAVYLRRLIEEDMRNSGYED